MIGIETPAGSVKLNVVSTVPPEGIDKGVGVKKLTFTVNGSVVIWVSPVVGSVPVTTRA